MALVTLLWLWVVFCCKKCSFCCVLWRIGDIWWSLITSPLKTANRNRPFSNKDLSCGASGRAAAISRESLPTALLRETVKPCMEQTLFSAWYQMKKGVSWLSGLIESKWKEQRWCPGPCETGTQTPIISDGELFARSILATSEMPLYLWAERAGWFTSVLSSLSEV